MWCDQQTTDIRLAAMDWETSLLGRKIGRVEGLEAERDAVRAAGALKAIEQEAVTAGFTLIVARVSADHFAAVRTLEESGFLLVDVGVTFQYELGTGTTAAADAPEGVRLREATADDIPRLREAVKGLFLHSYYYASPFFAGAEADLLFATWVSNCVRGDRADRVVLAEVAGAPAGVVTCRMSDGHIGVIDLIAAVRRNGSRGIGKLLVAAALECFLELGATVVKVRTQATNLAAVNLYVATGARLIHVDATVAKSLST
jgi:dTDP-4-amino-4,6-dideoxy-D-galactose acyltransferase